MCRLLIWPHIQFVVKLCPINIIQLHKLNKKIRIDQRISPPIGLIQYEGIRTVSLISLSLLDHHIADCNLPSITYFPLIEVAKEFSRFLLIQPPTKRVLDSRMFD
jgi:hypothetical protein